MTPFTRQFMSAHDKHQLCRSEISVGFVVHQLHGTMFFSHAQYITQLHIKPVRVTSSYTMICIRVEYDQMKNVSFINRLIHEVSNVSSKSYRN